MEVRIIEGLITRVAIAGLLSVTLLWGGVPAGESLPTQAFRFIEEEMPAFHSELLVILSEMPEMKEEVSETVLAIHEDYLRVLGMSNELAAIYLTIKKRELQNQIMAEKILGHTDLEKRRSELKKLSDHMKVTFDLHLRLVSGELAWLERQIEQLRELVDSEKKNKQRYLQEDLVSLLLNNEPLLSISIRGLGEKRTQVQRMELRKLIAELSSANPIR